MVGCMARRWLTKLNKDDFCNAMHIEKFNQQQSQEAKRNLRAGLLTLALFVACLGIAIMAGLSVGAATGVGMLLAVICYAFLPAILRRMDR